MKKLSQSINEGIKHVEMGDYKKARDIFQELYKNHPENPDVLYNYGLLLNELQEFGKSSEILKKLVGINPEYKNAKVALAYAYLNLKNPAEAEKLLIEARVTDSNNIFLLRNLGTIYAKKGEFKEALEIFYEAERLDPNNRPILYGIALALFHQEEFGQSSDYLEKIIVQNVDDEFDNLSKNLQRQIAERIFSKDGIRIDAVYYCLGALEKFNEMSYTQIQGITFEISMLGRSGLDPSDSNTRYELSSIPGDFSALQLLCFMYVGFKILKPEIDIGFDLSKEYSAAKAMFEKQHGY